MGDINTMDDDLANLNIMDDEEEPMVMAGDEIANGHLNDFCLVGRVLTDSVVNFPPLKNTLADLWHPLRGVAISEFEGNRILFRFYCDIDLQRIMAEGLARQFGDFIKKFLEYDASMVIRGVSRFMRIGAKGEFERLGQFTRQNRMRRDDRTCRLLEISKGQENGIKMEDTPVEIID
ncbi:hypothetical protein GOBAR_AA39785 [Gossypium barbadense]|uniref:DUF4283 domain-containing protein n=1 Tax=Gossypium barbadense TaxID=3634 RepID=A0A2P5VQ47_GOSBA|nr:hypothetical protein GOBAR_AA39785 [Gossypium barbadense]